MADPAELALYVHWPFCQAKCPYCDFNSHVSAHVDQGRWRAAFEVEIARTREEIGDRRLTSIFFGGGTPSLMAPETVARVIDVARAAWTPVNDMEITLEANPTSVEAGRFAGYRGAGVNRVSMGLQALNDSDLKALGRLHSAEEGLAAFDVARQVFDRCSFDLIYARQDQSLAAWRAELERALSLAPDHVSFYQLTIEPGTAFGDRFARGRLSGLPDEDLTADMYAATQEACEAAGLPAYEISNHARSGAESRHNLTYWEGGDWAGIGPGAHGRFTLAGERLATEAIRAPTGWLDAVDRGSGEAQRHAIPKDEVREERLMMGLRLSGGVDMGREIEDLTDKINHINQLTDFQLLETRGDRIRLTPEGRPLLNAVLRELLA